MDLFRLVSNKNNVIIFENEKANHFVAIIIIVHKVSDLKLIETNEK